MKYVIMCCGGFPVLDDNRVNLCDFPDELQDSDFFSSVERAKERVLALRRDKNYKYEDFSIMKIHDFDAIMDEDLTALEEVKVCRPKN